jgi:hypothetical protein
MANELLSENSHGAEFDPSTKALFAHIADNS